MLRILPSTMISCGDGLNNRVQLSVYSLLKGVSIVMLMVWSGWSGWDQGITSVSRSFTAFVFGSGRRRCVVEVLAHCSGLLLEPEVFLYMLDTSGLLQVASLVLGKLLPAWFFLLVPASLAMWLV